MAETMTYDPGTDTVTTEDNLTGEEKESLQVGEALDQQQEQMLAGKYRNAEELEKAYIELERKLGSDEDKAKGEQEEVLSKESEEGSKNLSEGATLINDASTEYYSNNNKLSQETIDKIYNMDTKSLVDSYLEAVNNNPATDAPVADLSEASVNDIKQTAGGAQYYDSMINWAKSNLDAKSTEAFDSVVSAGNVDMIKLAVTGLKAEYENANGYEGRMLTGKSARSSGDTFRSQQELVAAMSDRRYDQDPAYRQDVIEKLDRSDIQF